MGALRLPGNESPGEPASPSPTRKRTRSRSGREQLMRLCLALSILCGILWGATRVAVLMESALRFGTSWLPFQGGLQTAADFQRNRKQLDEVIALVRRDALTRELTNGHLRQLPWQYRYLSNDGGQIVVVAPTGNTKVLFFSVRGMLSGSRGLLHAADDKPMMPGEVIRRAQKQERHWYWVETE